MARGSWRSRWPAPLMTRSSAAPCDASARVGRGRTNGKGAARARAGQPDPANHGIGGKLVDGGDDVVAPTGEREVALRSSGAAERENQHRPARVSCEAVSEYGVGLR